MNHWNYKAKHTLTLALNSRITIGAVQTRGDGPNSPWWINLQGVGADPETGKPPACELDASLTDEQMQKAALDWAWPKIRAFVDEQEQAIAMAAMLMHRDLAPKVRDHGVLTGQPMDELTHNDE